jgi:hypothetical protein
MYCKMLKINLLCVFCLLSNYLLVAQHDSSGVANQRSLRLSHSVTWQMPLGQSGEALTTVLQGSGGAQWGIQPIHVQVFLRQRVAANLALSYSRVGEWQQNLATAAQSRYPNKQVAAYTSASQQPNRSIFSLEVGASMLFERGTCFLQPTALLGVRNVRARSAVFDLKTPNANALETLSIRHNNNLNVYFTQYAGLQAGWRPRHYRAGVCVSAGVLRTPVGGSNARRTNQITGEEYLEIIGDAAEYRMVLSAGVFWDL